MTTIPCLTADALATDLAVRDLTDPASGPHAIQLIVAAVLDAATARHPQNTLIVHRGTRIVDIADNYDHLGYSPSAAARDGRYARYVDATRMLRSQTSALIPGALRHLPTEHAPPRPRQPATESPQPPAHDPDAPRHPSTERPPTPPPGPDAPRQPAPAVPRDVLLACPGMVYRRDAIDRLHTGTPHQLDLWRLTHSPADLLDLVATAVGAALPGVPWRTRPAVHPYTTGGLEIEARCGTGWVEIGECGLAADHVLAGTGWTGLALGLGLDRLVMLRKGVDDIRLLRSTDPRVAAQMTDLTPYRPVSAQPAARRDLSLALPPGLTDEDLGDRVRTLLGPDADLVEEVTILAETAAADLPAHSRDRLAIRDGEVNVLLRITLRDLHRTLPKQAANALRDRVHTGLRQAAQVASHGYTADGE